MPNRLSKIVEKINNNIIEEGHTVDSMQKEYTIFIEKESMANFLL